MLSLFSAVFATGVLVIAAGPVGVILAPTMAVAWYLYSPAMAFAIGQVVLVALFPKEGTLNLLVFCEVGLAGVLLSPALDQNEPVRTIVTLLGVGSVLGMITGVGMLSGGLWFGALGLISSGMVAAYSIHRYERVTLGLVEAS